MTAAKHTPGPWHAVGAWVETEDDSVADICSCDPDTIGQGGRSDAEICANARLIAAAPDLLAALSRLEFAAQCRENTLGDQLRLVSVKAELVAAAEQARAVIAKATNTRTMITRTICTATGGADCCHRMQDGSCGQSDMECCYRVIKQGGAT